MLFFNKKEDVLDIQLTSYGRHVLSRGEFRPAYYRFFDDGVVYDIDYAPGGTELQNETQVRILEETSRLRTQSAFYTGSSTCGQNAEAKALEAFSENFALNRMQPLGTADNTTQNLPAWNIRAASGAIYSASMNSTGTNITMEDLKFEINIKNKESLSDDEYNNEKDLFLASRIFDDNRFLHVTPGEIVLEVVEENGVLKRENFNIEIFTLQDGTETPLRFATKKRVRVVDDILIDEQPIEESVIDKHSVEYYMNIDVDSLVEEVEEKAESPLAELYRERTIGPYGEDC